MSKLQRSLDVNTSGDVVFDLLTDLNGLPEWSTITVETHGTPRQPIEEGDTFAQTLRVLDQQVQTEWRVTELSRPRTVAYETTGPGGGRLVMKQTVDDSAGVSRVQFELDYDLPQDLAALLESDEAQRRNERELDLSLQRLKSLAESRSGR
jgi:uncharacterized membrane protein